MLHKPRSAELARRERSNNQRLREELKQEFAEKLEKAQELHQKFEALDKQLLDIIRDLKNLSD